ncbi:hypothetical protein [Pseudomonas sp. TUM22785]|uniref:hypothetical protein n=1 Tax=Pseudomonas sp. TUM22785 TaxID=3019098 RepID=UPI0023061B4D|nr:hypothetical protein [Pseudomonas sp. TUM22785]WCD82979.1 hypothetical protein PI990_13425 [Pseudomonas sp. TUM22785]
MKISLIENGLDSLEKGYIHLKKYEEAKESAQSDSARFYILKDATLAIQHGAEILFKYLLKTHNETLLYSDLSRLKEAYRQKHAGEIDELFEADGVHTISYRECIDRIIDMCNIPIDKKLKDNCIKVEKWRNGITHSAVILNEFEVSSVLTKFFDQLDIFFSKTIGDAYVDSPGKANLDRAFRRLRSQQSPNENEVEHKAIERLIHALKINKITEVTTPGVLRVTDTMTAVSILRSMQGDEISYGFDMSNLHCSGKSSLTTVTSEGAIVIFSEDTKCEYHINLKEMIIFIPHIGAKLSPLIFIYSKKLPTLGHAPIITEYKSTKTQRGHKLADGSFVWDKDEYENLDEEHYSEGGVDVERFLSSVCACFMNIQKLEHGAAKRLMFGNPPSSILFDALKQAASQTRSAPDK